MTNRHKNAAKLPKRDIGAEIIAGLREIGDRPETLSRTKLGPLDMKAKGVRLKEIYWHGLVPISIAVRPIAWHAFELIEQLQNWMIF